MTRCKLCEYIGLALLAFAGCALFYTVWVMSP